MDNVAVAGQTSDSFAFTASGLGSFEIKVLVTDGKDYVTKKWSVSVSAPAQEQSFGVTGAAVVEQDGFNLWRWLGSLFS